MMKLKKGKPVMLIEQYLLIALWVKQPESNILIWIQSWGKIWHDDSEESKNCFEGYLSSQLQQTQKDNRDTLAYLCADIWCNSLNCSI